MSEERPNNRKRVVQTRKRGIEDRSLETVKADRLSREPLGLKMRALPRAESRKDAVLSALAVGFGLLCVIFLFVFFSGSWPPSGYLVLLSFVGILVVAAIDSWPRKRALAWLAIAGAAALLVLTAILAFM